MSPNEVKPRKECRRSKNNKKRNPLVQPNKINIKSEIYKRRKRKDCVCPVCGKTLKHLRVHLQSHSNEKPFACDLCGMRFKRKDHVRNHRKQVHENCTLKNKNFHLRRKNFACSLCEKKFASNSVLSDHIQRHSGEKNFECTKCAKRFPVKVALINHEKRVHGLLLEDSNETGTQSKQCELCLKVLPSPISYYHHRRWHNKIFICEQCGKGFHENSLLVQHKRIHTGERPFKCSKCDKSFSLKGSLALHVKSHTGERPYPCPYCKWRCCKKSNLDAHIRTHTGEKPFLCPICSRGFAQANDMRKHTLTHDVVKGAAHCISLPSSEVNYENEEDTTKIQLTKDIMLAEGIGSCDFSCPHCQESFSLERKLKIHLLSHSDDTPFSCDVCDLKFKTKSHVRYHTLRIHKGNCVQKTGLTSVSKSDSIKRPGKKFKNVNIIGKLEHKVRTCELCGKNFKSLKSLKIHSVIHSSDRPFSCDLCESKFKRKDHFRNHKKRTHGNSGAEVGCVEDIPSLNTESIDSLGTDQLSKEITPQQTNLETKSTQSNKKRRKDCICPICGKTFQFTKNLRVHLKSHSNDRPYPCDACGMRFKRRDHVRNHKNQMHEGKKVQKNYQIKKKVECTICNKMLGGNSALHCHIRQHTGERPFQCSECAKSFFSKSSLNSHEKIKHTPFSDVPPITPQKHYQCDKCGKMFPTYVTYYHHQRNYNKVFVCELCGKSYKERCLLISHMRVHTGERPFKCGKCEKSFRIKSALVAHDKMHTDERPYPCPHCTWRCRKNSDLVVHIRTHTGEKPFLCGICSRGFAQVQDMRKHRLTHNLVK